MVESLTVIFGEENLSVNEAVIFPGEDEIIEMLKEEEAMETESGRPSTESDPPSLPTSSPDTDTAPIQYNFNQPLAVIWEEERGMQWYVGFYLDGSDDGTFRVDHLVRSETGSKMWQRPPGSDDIQDTIDKQVVPVAVIGCWDLKRKPTFLVTNSDEIEKTFRQICK